ncbi:MAG: hypothetical protein ACXABG_15765, partial [Promethearchaeota archaeon]
MENPGKNIKTESKSKDNEHEQEKKSSKISATSKSKEETKKVKTKKEIVKKEKKSFSNEEDFELDIPLVPESPKQKDKITINSPGLSPDLVTKMKKLESGKNKVVLVNCERCEEIIAVPIPKAFVL